jgi:uncharacterized membrane protein YcaP (DUF421 family)
MGKRQIGEMQPTELVITILLSEVAALPIQDSSQPIINSIIAVSLLVSFEIINSILSLKIGKYRTMVQGNSLIVIRNGVIDQKQILRLRLTVDDLLESLREKGVFDIKDVEYAILETNGKISVMLKPEKRPATPEVLNIKVEDTGMPFVVAYDGKIIDDNFKECNLSMEKFNSIVNNKRVRIKEILLMTVDKSGEATIIKKEKPEK